jgi:hypothetical protein
MPPAPTYAPLYERGGVSLIRHDEEASEWGVDEVGEWLNRIGLGEHAAKFKKHKIVGVQLSRLTEAHLVELGMAAIGDRLLLLSELDAISVTKSRVLWEGEEVWSFHGPFDWLWKKHLRAGCRKAICLRPAFWDQYKLTSEALIVTQRDRGMLDDAVCCARAIKMTTRHIELWNITGVTVKSAYKESDSCDFGVVTWRALSNLRRPAVPSPSPAATSGQRAARVEMRSDGSDGRWWQADEVTIELDKMRLLKPLQPLTLPAKTSPALVTKIMEIIQKHHRGPTGAKMAR